MRACSGGIDPARLANNFELFGMDFMIDSSLEVWLIEINSNPCL
jgi:D-alanine-D-alanine ligase-like ATP-grasp enzyme